jgi:hypothetical protein
LGCKVVEAGPGAQALTFLDKEANLFKSCSLDQFGENAEGV